MPLTLADVFLGLGSGFGGTGFCGNNLNHTNTETDTISLKKKTNGLKRHWFWLQLWASRTGPFSTRRYLHPEFASDGQIRRS